MCAGIDPGKLPVPPTVNRFPRVCGDRPGAALFYHYLTEVPPCVRG